MRCFRSSPGRLQVDAAAVNACGPWQRELMRLSGLEPNPQTRLDGRGACYAKERS